MSLPAMQVETKGSIQLVKNNYEIIFASFVDHVYVKVTNLINYSSYESKIHSYDSTHEYIKTTKDLWNIIKRAFKIIECKNINILEPPNLDNDEDFIWLKLLEQHNNVVLTVYYNIAMSFEFNITLNKIKSEGSIIDLTKVKYEMENKDKQIKNLQSKVSKLELEMTNIYSICSNIECMVGIRKITIGLPHGYGSPECIQSIFYCKLNTDQLDIKEILEFLTDFSNLYNLKKLTLTNPSNAFVINSNTLESLIINSSITKCTTQISTLSKLKYLEFFNCSASPISYDLLENLKEHPNKKNIEMVIKSSTYFNNTIEQYRSIGLKSVTVC